MQHSLSRCSLASCINHNVRDDFSDSIFPPFIKRGRLASTYPGDIHFFLRLLKEEGHTYPGDTHANLSRLLANLTKEKKSKYFYSICNLSKHEGVVAKRDSTLDMFGKLM
jgi:hypothetical protein